MRSKSSLSGWGPVTSGIELDKEYLQLKMLPLLLELFFLLILLLGVGLTVYARWNYGILDGLGFPVMKPSFILGSAPNLHTKVQHFEDMERYRKYGPIWGYYQGRTPIVYVADPELIRTIFVKDNAHFYNREPFEFGNPIVSEILDYLPGEKWKTMRSQQTKLFSVSKIKQYFNEVYKDSMDTFVARLDEDVGNAGSDRLTVDTRDRFCTYTVDIIGRSLFSMKVDPVTDRRFYEACQKLIGDDQTVDQFYVWTLAFPFLARFQPTLVLDPAMPERFKEIIKSRSESGKSFGDYVDMMTHSFTQLSSSTYKSLGITQETVLGQGVNLFLAGFDRISSYMTFLAYHLARAPHIQDKLYTEILDVLGQEFDGQLHYQALQKMEYLNACILEISRLYSVFIRPERVCNKEWIDPVRGVRIPKGVVVMIASWAVNRDPQNYDDPDSFLPERFLPENKGNLNPYALTSFGFGHRNCIGMRFTYEAIKVSMVKILSRYQFEVNDKTTLKFKTGLNLILQFEPLYLDFVQRVPEQT